MFESPKVVGSGSNVAWEQLHDLEAVQGRPTWTAPSHEWKILEVVHTHIKGKNSFRGR